LRGKIHEGAAGAAAALDEALLDSGIGILEFV